jgi:hypothetical protein
VFSFFRSDLLFFGTASFFIFIFHLLLFIAAFVFPYVLFIVPYSSRCALCTAPCQHQYSQQLFRFFIVFVCFVSFCFVCVCLFCVFIRSVVVFSALFPFFSFLVCEHVAI